MAAEGTMTIDDRRKYLKRMQVRYRAADRAGGSILLTEMKAVIGLFLREKDLITAKWRRTRDIPTA